VRALHSFLYEGQVSHARLDSVSHAFTYGLYMLYLDLDELPKLSLGPLFGVERARPLSFRRKDYLGASTGKSLDRVVRDKVEESLGRRPQGAIRMLTQVRSFGYAFNPVTFYYCFGRDEKLEAVAAEIINTPWKERHTYVLSAGGQGARASFAKAFHISPFQPMDQDYRWRFNAPGEELRVEMANQKDGRDVFHASLRLKRQPLTAKSLALAALHHPLIGWKVPFSIYFQALRLWVKRAPFYTHPTKIERRGDHAKLA